MDVMRYMQLANWVVSLASGSVGIFCLWWSFVNGALGAYAAEFLVIALVLELGGNYLKRASSR